MPGIGWWRCSNGDDDGDGDDDDDGDDDHVDDDYVDHYDGASVQQGKLPWATPQILSTWK